MMFVLWLLVLCYATSRQGVEVWSRETSWIDSKFGNEAGMDRDERCKLCKNRICRHILHTWEQDMFSLVCPSFYSG